MCVPRTRLVIAVHEPCMPRVLTFTTPADVIWRCPRRTRLAISFVSLGPSYRVEPLSAMIAANTLNDSHNAPPGESHIDTSLPRFRSWVRRFVPQLSHILLVLLVQRTHSLNFRLLGRAS